MPQSWNLLETHVFDKKIPYAQIDIILVSINNKLIIVATSNTTRDFSSK